MLSFIPFYTGAADMSDVQYDRDTLAQQPLINQSQWDRLSSELGLDMLLEFVSEFLEETQTQWIDVVLEPSSMEPKAFRSMAHKAAGAAGTIGLARLRHVFLCMEHTPIGAETMYFLETLPEILGQTRAWVQSRQ